MKSKVFDRNILIVFLLFIVCGIILLAGMIFKDIFLKVPPIIRILLFCIELYALPIIITLMIYKRKAKGEINYWKSFLIALATFGIISIISIASGAIVRFMDDGYVLPLSYFGFVSLRMLGIGIASSLIAALFPIYFWKKNEKVPLS